MFLMARGTRFILYNVRFVKRMPRMTRLAFSIDWLEWNSIAETFPHYRRKFRGGQEFAIKQRLVVALCAVVRKSGMAGRYLAWVEECLSSAFLKDPNSDQAADNGCDGDDKTPASPGMETIVIAKVSLVPLGNLLLRAAGTGHGYELNLRRYLGRHCAKHVGPRPAPVLASAKRGFVFINSKRVSRRHATLSASGAERKQAHERKATRATSDEA